LKLRETGSGSCELKCLQAPVKKVNIHMKISKKLSLYLIFTFGISWSLVIGYSIAGGNLSPMSTEFFLMALGFMLTPMISVILVEKLVFKNRLRSVYPINLRWNRWWLIAWLSPLAIALAAFGAGLLVPGVEFSSGMEGMFDRFSNILTPEQLEQMRNTPMPVHPFFLSIAQGLIAGITINALAGFGEELGWRGLMLNELSHMGFWKTSWITGLVWGVWHAPVIMMGHNYPDHPMAGVVMMIIFCLLFSPFFTLVALRSGSIIAVAVLHGSFNALSGVAVLLLKGGNDLLIGTTGAAGLSVLVVLNLVVRKLPGTSSS
jgi:membrane protease YdiL (CAAX protease family)